VIFRACIIEHIIEGETFHDESLSKVCDELTACCLANILKSETARCR